MYNAYFGCTMVIKQKCIIKLLLLHHLIPDDERHHGQRYVAEMRNHPSVSAIRRISRSVSDDVRDSPDGPDSAQRRRRHRVHQTNHHRLRRNGWGAFERVLMRALHAIELFLVFVPLF